MKRPKSSSTMALRLMDAADLLLQEGKRSRAFRRRAVSTAYYAVFHALAKVCADYHTRSAPRNTDVYSRVYRALNHGSIKDAFRQAGVKDSMKLSRIGAAFEKLQTAREDADYRPPTTQTLTAQAAQELLDQARDTVEDIQKLKPADDDCRILAVYLTIPKSRKDRIP